MVTKRSGGLFLYSKLTMDQIEAILPTTDRLDIALLESFLPIGLEQTYTSLLLKYREGSGITADAQMLVLEAVTHASRPLRLNEVASLINTIYPDVTAPYGFEALVSTCCGPLIEILEDETLQVIHHSFTEFLGNNSTFNTQKAHKRMAIGCLRYLQSVWPVCKPQKPPTFTGDNDPIELLKHADKGFVEYQNSRLLHPFLAYAMNNWAYHASQHDVQDPDLFQAVLEFAHTENPALNKWVDLIMVPLSSCYWVPYIAEKGCQTRTRTTALHIAAYAGLSHLCEHLVQSDPTSISAPDKLFRNPLHWAAENGHSNVAAVLLQHKTHPDCSDIQQIKPIHLAAWRGHASIVKILCIAGVTPNSRTAGNNGPESSSLISQRWKGAYGWSGRETRVKPYDGTIEGGGCAIYYAMLENSDVSADATYLGATALYYAVRRGNVRCVSALINQGADVCKMSNWWPGNVGAGRGTSRCRPQELRAPLHEAIHVWNKENGKECESIMRLLIDAGADIEQESGNGETPLLLCFGSRRACFIRGLMPRGPIMVLLGYLAAAADVKKTRPPCNDVALHLALQDYKDLEVILALLDHGSNPNRRDANGQTALHSAFNHNGRQVWGKDPEAALAMVQLLLDRGADPTIKDNSGHSAVHQAMLTGHEVFRMLLSKCHDESVKVECWFALTEIEESKFSRCVKILLAEGIDINTKREKDGRTLFLCCTDSIAKLHVLHSIGLDPHAVDASGHNALQIEFLFPRGYRSPSQYRRSVKDLIRNFGLDPRVANNNGDTLLHHYSRSNLNSGWLEVARWFISLGISVNATNNKGQTALHVFLEQMCQAKLKYKVRWPSRCLLDIGDEKNLINFEIRDGNGLAPLHLAAMVSEVQFDLI
ncbi:ankyrin repeat-containing domain protein, partial [Podospora fimiseda]